MSQDANDLPPWKLERIALGELEGTGSDQEERLVAEINESNREILAALPTADVVREVERRLQRARRAERVQKRPWTLVALGTVTAAIAVVLLLPRLSDAPQTGQQGGNDSSAYTGQGSERAKGDERLLIQVQRDNHATEIEPDDEVAAGDLLQLSYLAAGRRFGTIISIDGRGTVTQHLPESGSSAAGLIAHGRTALPSSYELDDAPAFERFYFVTSQTPFDIRQVLTSAESLAPSEQRLSLERGLRQHVFSVRKTDP